MIHSPQSELICTNLGDTVKDYLRTIPPTHRYIRVAGHRFLSYLRANFPEVLQLSDLRRDPHLLGWLGYFHHENPPLANYTRRIYMVGLRRLFRDLTAQGHPLQSGLILREDFPSRRKFPRQPRPHKERVPPPPHTFSGIFDTATQALTTTLKPSAIQICKSLARRFLSYLEKEFPELVNISELRRDPHLLSWYDHLAGGDPPLSHFTHDRYRLQFCRLMLAVAAQQNCLSSSVFLEDFQLLPAPKPTRRIHGLPAHPFAPIFDTCIQNLATTLRPNTVHNYRMTTRCFLAYLAQEFPDLVHVSQLRRHIHIFGWLRQLAEHVPPLSNASRQGHVLRLRHLLCNLPIGGGAALDGLIVSSDAPPRPQYLPRPLCSEDDELLQQELHRIDDLPANALLLMRGTGIRIGECLHLGLDCLQSVGQDQWALRVPLGKLYTERLVPIDEDLRRILARIVQLRALAHPACLVRSANFLLPRGRSAHRLGQNLRDTLDGAVLAAGCSTKHVTPHQLRHTYATEMVRLGVNLPTLMRLLGHKDIRMTLRYVQITHEDLQREFHLARQNAPQPHHPPILPLQNQVPITCSDLTGITQSLAATHHLLEMYRRQLADKGARHKLHLLDKRLLKVSLEINRLAKAEN